MRTVHVAIGINDAGDSLTIQAIDPQRPHAFAPEFRLADLDQRCHAGASRSIGSTVLALLRMNHPDVFAPYPELVGPPEDSAALEDIETAIDLMNKSLAEKTQLYLPVIDRLMRVDPAKRVSNHQFMVRWPTMRALIVDHYRTEASPK